MARTFRRPRQAHPIAELNVTNLIDLGFTLLIIFMIATAASKNEQTIPLNLPIESRSQQKPEPLNQVFIPISIDAQGQFYLDNHPIGRTELRQRLQELASRPKKPVMRIRIDTTQPYGKFIELKDELQKAGLTEVTLDTQTQS